MVDSEKKIQKNESNKPYLLTFEGGVRLRKTMEKGRHKI